MTKKNGKKKAEEVSVPSPGSLKSEVVEQKKEEQVPSNLQNAEITDEVQVQTMKVKTEEVKVEQHSCGECRHYNHSSERLFHRDGIREGLVETRAICKAPKERTKASNHLVKKESVRTCIELGKYVAPVKEQKSTKEQPVKTKKTSKKTSAEKKPKDDAEKILEKVEKAFENGAEEVDVQEDGSVTPTSPRAKVFEGQGRKRGKERFILVSKEQ
jgi:hypothetical protein